MLNNLYLSKFTGSEADQILTDAREHLLNNHIPESSNLEYYQFTKSNIKKDEKITISKQYDPYYKSVILSIQEFVKGETETEVVREYNNANRDSFEPNEYVSFDDGLALINSKIIGMEPIKELENRAIYREAVNLIEFEDMKVI